ncbi:MAG: hypothetical protein OXG51_12750 [Gammaproteobacteria bacterium]|nr:hypothetical protein [Gammaproteobacteria bacterium]
MTEDTFRAAMDDLKSAYETMRPAVEAAVDCFEELASNDRLPHAEIRLNAAHGCKFTFDVLLDCAIARMEDRPDRVG